ncbi:unnamed protein product [Phaedon cochleariae]|uniref:Uncharacterized protein n=1 Tax=Phaedon cochleariae TaxID=80249 RepID=A0A9N9SM57_PHACE|nr:unnamed protein product [Phaedon cochleariae]
MIINSVFFFQPPPASRQLSQSSVFEKDILSQHPNYQHQQQQHQQQQQQQQFPSKEEQHHLQRSLSTNNNVKVPPLSAPAAPVQTPPSSPHPPAQSKRLLQEILARPGPRPMIAVPPKGGYWVDGTDHEDLKDHRGRPVVPPPTWRAKIETDDTANMSKEISKA